MYWKNPWIPRGPVHVGLGIRAAGGAIFGSFPQQLAGDFVKIEIVRLRPAKLQEIGVQDDERTSGRLVFVSCEFNRHLVPFTFVSVHPLRQLCDTHDVLNGSWVEKENG